MKTKLIVLVSLLASACTFQVEVLNTPTSQPSESILTPLPTSTPFLNLDLSATPPPFPTFTPTPLAPVEPAVSTVPPTGVIPIVFAANTTFQTVSGNVAAGSSQSYSLDAFQGQIMSVSILPEKPELNGSFQLEIKGSDGAVLCPFKDYSCPFWRGALPSTQEYIVKVSSQTAGGFTLLVAINPPGMSNQFFRYEDPQGSFDLSYPDEFAPAYYTAAQVSKFDPQLVLEYIDTEQYIPTNLGEAYFMIGRSDDPQQVRTCTEPVSLAGQEWNIGEVKINGQTFTRSEVQSVAAGNIYELVYHRIVKNDVCYEIIYFTHFANIKNYAPGNVKEFDRSGLLQKFDAILASLRLQ